MVNGGTQNTASADGATVNGGLRNIAGGQEAAVAGGFDNTASGAQSSVGGGRYNEAGGTGATVAGGGSGFASAPNIAFADYSMIAGGLANVAGDGISSLIGSDSWQVDMGVGRTLER